MVPIHRALSDLVSNWSLTGQVRMIQQHTFCTRGDPIHGFTAAGGWSELMAPKSRYGIDSEADAV
jgi:hypothetical protein